MEGKALRKFSDSDPQTRGDNCGKLASIQQIQTAKVIIKKENEFGIGDQVDQDLGKDQLAGFNAGCLYQEMSDKRPSRMCARHSADMYCEGGDEKLTFEWFF